MTTFKANFIFETAKVPKTNPQLHILIKLIHKAQWKNQV